MLADLRYAERVGLTGNWLTDCFEAGLIGTLCLQSHGVKGQTNTSNVKTHYISFSDITLTWYKKTFCSGKTPDSDSLRLQESSLPHTLITLFFSYRWRSWRWGESDVELRRCGPTDGWMLGDEEYEGWGRQGFEGSQGTRAYQHPYLDCGVLL